MNSYIEYGKFDSPDIKYGYDTKLDNYRNMICNIPTTKWKKLRFQVNPFDFHTKSFKKIKIINRAFYKYWEIIVIYKLLDDITTNDIILQCAEAPGGFIQGSILYLKNKNTKPDKDGFFKVKYSLPKIYTMSIEKKHNSYHKLIKNNNSVKILNNDNCDGDITKLDNISYLKNTINIAKIITADGGFDEGKLYNIKEQLHYNLIFHEILTALTLQEKNGHFLLKVFDIYTETSIHMLYLLYLHYTSFNIYKPKTSRPTNSEKYIICKNFKGISSSNLEILVSHSKNISGFKKFTFKLFEFIPSDFISLIKNYNQVFLNNQCQSIQDALNENFDKYKHFNFETWKKDYNFNLE